MSACEFCGVDREDALAEHLHEITKLTAALSAAERRTEEADRGRAFEAEHRDFANSCCADEPCREGACCNDPEYGECRKCLRARAALSAPAPEDRRDD